MTLALEVAARLVQTRLERLHLRRRYCGARNDRSIACRMHHAPLAWSRLLGGLAITPVSVAFAVWSLPRVALGPGAADFVAFAGAVGVALAGLAVCAAVAASRRVIGLVTLTAVATLGVIAYRRATNGVVIIAVDTALVALAWALGASLGRRVQHESHLFPACVVAASADVVSVLSPEGPSHAVAQSEHALSVLAIWFPVPGTNAVAPALGVGDLLFIAFVLGVASAHRLGYGRALVCILVGLGAAGFAAARLGVAVPALVPIAAASIVGLPRIRKLRPVDQRAAQASIAIALSLVVVTLARAALGR
jgi:hypothetical protein